MRTWYVQGRLSYSFSLESVAAGIDIISLGLPCLYRTAVLGNW